MTVVKYRSAHPRLIPRRTRLEIPGWAGQPQPRVDGAHEYPWHCIPFSESARAGLELCYPHDDELRVTTRAGVPEFAVPPGADTPAFRSFGRDYYTYQILIDLKVTPELAVRVETHPRFYTDTSGTVPIAVPAMLRHWWPMIYFVVFKSPAEGQTHIFRPGEPFLQISIVDAERKLEVVAMPEEEAAERELQSRRIHASRETLSADTQWVSDTDTVFDGTYRKIHGAARTFRDDDQA